MASRRSSRLGSRSASTPTIDPLTPLLTAVSESSSTERSPSSGTKVTLTRSSSRKRSTSKKRSVSKSRKRSIGKGRPSSRSTTSLEFLQGLDSDEGRQNQVEASTSISPKTKTALHTVVQGSYRMKELPLPFDVLWLAICTMISFLYALAAVHPEQLFHEYALGGVLRAMLPAGGVDLLFLRCSVAFLLGSLPIRYWATNHFSETHIGSDLLVFSIVGVVKLALIQLFMFKSNEAFYQAAMLHASLGFAVQEFIININSSPFTSSLQRIIEITGNSMILFVTVDDLSLKAMAYTLTTLTLAKVLRAFIAIASSRESYRAFRKAVSIGHIALLSFGIPFIVNYLMHNAKEMNDDDNPTYAHILGPFICGGVLISSMILSHVDYLFN